MTSDLNELYERGDELSKELADELWVLRDVAEAVRGLVTRLDNITRLSKCPECLEWFLPSKRQKYCSPRCCSRASSRRHRRKNDTC